MAIAAPPRPHPRDPGTPRRSGPGRRWARLFFVVALLFAGAARTLRAAPEAPAVRVLQAWLTAFNTGDEAQGKAFDARYQPRRPMAQMAGFREQTGGFTLVRVEQADATSVTALLKENRGDHYATLTLTVSGDEPPRMLGLQIRPTPPPADLARPRLTEAEALAALTRHGEEAARAERFSGTVLVARRGKVLLEKSWGLAEREAKLPIGPATRFRIGSMNKMFTAVAVLQLVEAGKLSLGDTVGKLLPGYPDPKTAEQVTIRHLLTHTGGTGDIFGPDFEKHRATLKTHGDYVQLYGSRPPQGVPGAAFAYSNYGFVLLGAIIERVTGMTYYDFVQQRIFAPTGMTGTGSLPEAERVPERATGYLRRDGAWVPNTETLPWRGSAAGGGYSTAEDLLRFAEALQGGRLVASALLAEAARDQIQGYGFGFGTAGQGPWRWYGHNGGAPGQNGELRILPGQGYVLIALSNLDPPAATEMVDFIVERLPEVQ